MAGRRRNDVGSSSNGIPSNPSDFRQSVVTDLGRRRSSCGYCKAAGRTSFTHGLWADNLTVNDYQDLLDRGWRRSGCYLYKPDMEKSCCPSYTIRLKASNFDPSKEQLRVKKKLQRYLDGLLDLNKQSGSSISSSIYSSMTTNHQLENKHEHEDKDEEFLRRMSRKLDDLIYEWTRSCDLPHDFHLPKAYIKKVPQAKRKLLAEGFEMLLYTSTTSFQIASVAKRALSTENTRHKKEDIMLSEISPDIIAEKLAGSLSRLDELSNLSVRACKGHVNFYTVVKDLNGKLGAAGASRRYGANLDIKDSYLRNQEYGRSKRHILEIRLNRSRFDAEEYALYRKYQIAVHHDNPDHVSESSYRRFLVDSPLAYVPYSDNDIVPMCGFGSFHQQYLIDGQLVAVGVIDILPSCLSSKYLFWDPDFAFLSLGKFSAIKEIEWVQENQTSCPSLQYYYLGYYIHSCPKMRYKAAYYPSELLCPLRYQWVPFNFAKPLLDAKSYVVLSDLSALENIETAGSNHVDSMAEEEQDHLFQGSESKEIHDLDSEDSEDEIDTEPDTLSQVEIDYDLYNVLIGLGGSLMKFKDISRILSPSQKDVLESHLYQYVKAVGGELSRRMVYSLG